MEEYQSIKSKIDKCSYFLEGSIPKDKIDYIIKEEEKKIKKVNVLNIPTTSDTFKKIINKAFERESPFVKSKGDKGFKDALIWESVLNEDSINNLDKFYFFSCDLDFDSKILEKEFKDVFKTCDISVINIENNNEKRQKALSIIINENNLLQTSITRLFNEDFILGFVRNLNSVSIDVKYSYNYNLNISIEFYDFDNDDLDIDDVVMDNNLYKVSVSIDTFKYSQNMLLPLCGILTLYIKEENGKYIFDNYKLDKLEFASSSIDKVNERLNTFSKIVVDSVSKDVERIKKELDRSKINDLVYAAQTDLIKYKEPISKMVEEAKKITQGSDYKLLCDEVNEVNNYFKSIPKLNDIGIINKAEVKSDK